MFFYLAPPAPQPPGIMNNGSRDNTKDIQKLQQQLQDIKDQVRPCLVQKLLLWQRMDEDLEKKMLHLYLKTMAYATAPTRNRTSF